MPKHPSDSGVQLRVEAQLVGALAAALGVTLQPARLDLNGCSVQVDGWNEEHQVVCEAFARLGDLKAGQKRKLSTDILKLILVQRAGLGVRRKIIVVAGEETLAWLCGGCWQARAVLEFGIEVFRVPLERAVGAEILKSQAEQVMINVKHADF